MIDKVYAHRHCVTTPNGVVLGTETGVPAMTLTFINLLQNQVSVESVVLLLEDEYAEPKEETERHQLYDNPQGSELGRIEELVEKSARCRHRVVLKTTKKQPLVFICLSY